MNLPTFRKSDDVVPTPVWFVALKAKLYVRTEAGSGKVKRIRNNERVELALSTIRGKTVGPTKGVRHESRTPGRKTSPRGLWSCRVKT
jgi:PPOX class probable F420-dependent enzyme